ncbi:MAG: 2-dehydro-3-deoxyphosphogluconate aldolase, partial [Planctomycetes bacterium]|nr:2-dehydro-3-deoxyphosphogluconate aldolase [Planctomycetota bacterium]
MSREEDLQRVLRGVIVAVVRSPSSEQLVEVARALAEGGVTTVEITLTVPGALDVIKDVRRRLGE